MARSEPRWRRGRDVRVLRVQSALESGARLGGALHVGYSRGGEETVEWRTARTRGLASSELRERGRETA